MKDLKVMGSAVLAALSRPEVPLLFAVGFLCGALMTLSSLRYQGLIDDSLTTLMGSALGAGITVVGALIASKFENTRKMISTRHSISRINETVGDWASARYEDVTKLERSVSDNSVDFVFLHDRDFVLRQLYILEGVLAAGHDVDLNVLPHALSLAATLRHFSEAGGRPKDVDRATVRVRGEFRAIGAVKAVLDASKQVSAALLL